MFTSVEEAIRVAIELSKLGDIDSKEYKNAIRYLKDNGYVMSSVGLEESSERWTYRALRRRIYTMRSFKVENCDQCVDEELYKGWHISTMKKDLISKVKVREGTDKYLF